MISIRLITDKNEVIKQNKSEPFLENFLFTKIVTLYKNDSFIAFRQKKYSSEWLDAAQNCLFCVSFFFA